MTSFVFESWMWFSLVMATAICRYTSRLLLFKSVQRLQIDDWAMLLALSFYTTLIVCINIEVKHSSNLFPPGYDISSLSQSDIKERVFGSKMVLVVEVSQCCTIWLVKACILCLYNRMTLAYTENILIRFIAGYVAVGFVVMEILYFGVWCRPFSDYWAVPSPNSQCTAATNHLIVNAVINLSSDLAIILIAIKIIFRSKLPNRKKIMLSGIFGLGVFVIICAVLNKVYSFIDPYGLSWTFWYVRESSTALLIGNIPLTWNLFRRLFRLSPFLHSETSNQSKSLSSSQEYRDSQHRYACREYQRPLQRRPSYMSLNFLTTWKTGETYDESAASPVEQNTETGGPKGFSKIYRSNTLTSMLGRSTVAEDADTLSRSPSNTTGLFRSATSNTLNRDGRFWFRSRHNDGDRAGITPCGYATDNEHSPPEEIVTSSRPRALSSPTEKKNPTTSITTFSSDQSTLRNSSGVPSIPRMPERASVRDSAFSEASSSETTSPITPTSATVLFSPVAWGAPNPSRIAPIREASHESRAENDMLHEDLAARAPAGDMC